MDIKSRVTCLAKIDLFNSFSDQELNQFAENIDEVEYAAGETIFAEGDLGSDMYILLKGTIKIFKNNRFITSLSPADYFGEMSIIEEKPRSATATATTPVVLLKISLLLFNDYLSHQPQSLVSMMKTLSMRIRSDTELIAEEFQRANILVHDMRNRLSALLLLDLIKKEELSEEAQKYIQIIRHSVQDLSIMMKEAMANAKRLKFNQTPEECSINKLILDLNDSEFITHKSLKNKKIHLNLSPNIKDFSFFPIDIRRVLSNLTINAGEASLPNGDIYISTHARSSLIEVLIKDHGCGIPDDIQSNIFNPHFTTKSTGNGLGLASCKEIIENKHQGKLSFETSKKGSTFRFTLPC